MQVDSNKRNRTPRAANNLIYYKGIDLVNIEDTKVRSSRLI